MRRRLWSLSLRKDIEDDNVSIKLNAKLLGEESFGVVYWCASLRPGALILRQSAAAFQSDFLRLCLPLLFASLNQANVVQKLGYNQSDESLLPLPPFNGLKFLK